MDHFAGVDVSVKETSICNVDDTGRIMKEVKVASELRKSAPQQNPPARETHRRVFGRRPQPIPG